MVDSSANGISVDSWSASDHVDDRKMDTKQSRPSAAARPLALKYSNEEEPRKKEWASSLLLIQEACEAIKASEERVESLERELEMAVFQARDEQRQTNAKLISAQEEVISANNRARTMEIRAQEAEGWLRRLNDAVVEGFGKQIKPDDQ